MDKTVYASERPVSGTYDVVFITDGKKLVRIFDGEFQARKFVNKMKRSRKCKLVSYPNFK